MTVVPIIHLKRVVILKGDMRMEWCGQNLRRGTRCLLAWAAVLLGCLPVTLAAQEIVPPTGFDDTDATWPWATRDDDDRCMHDMRRCCGDCCCPSWDTYAIFDVLYLQRNNSIGDRPLVLDDRGEPVMTSQDLQPGMATGTRVFFGRLINDAWGWEIGYTGIYGMFGEALVTAPDGLQLPPDLNSAVSNFGDAEAVRGTYWSSLNMTEVNLFRYRCCRECRPTRLACTNCRPNCHCINWIAGFVWAGLDEQSALAATCCDPPETTAYTVQTTTNYFGPQIGMRGRREWCRWAVEGWWKTALCGTAASQGQAPIVDTVTGLQERGAIRSSDTGVGFIGSLNATLIYRLTQVWGLRAGYNAYWLTNAAFAPNQWDFSTASDAGTTIRDNGTLFLHGVSLGVEARW
jgi:hypothetical protein